MSPGSKVRASWRFNQLLFIGGYFVSGDFFLIGVMIKIKVFIDHLFRIVKRVRIKNSLSNFTRETVFVRYNLVKHVE